MRLKDFYQKPSINEGKEKHTNKNGVDFMVLINPSGSEFKGFVNRLESGHDLDIRGLYDNGTIYLWDGFYNHHTEMKIQLGLIDPIHFTLTELRPTVISVQAWRDGINTDIPQKSPALSKALKYFKLVN